jgi:hypothetical protein
MALILCCAPRATAAGRMVALIVPKGNLDKVFQQCPNANKPEGMTHAVLAVARFGKPNKSGGSQKKLKCQLSTYGKNWKNLKKREAALTKFASGRKDGWLYKIMSRHVLAAPFGIHQTEGEGVSVAECASVCAYYLNANSIESVCVYVCEFSLCVCVCVCE